MSAAAPLAIALAVVWRNGRILVTRRGDTVPQAGKWELPGGKIEAGESPACAALRELREETGLTASALGELPTIEHDYPNLRVSLRPIECVFSAGEMRLNGPVDARWVLPAELLELDYPAANEGLFLSLAERVGPER